MGRRGKRHVTHTNLFFFFFFGFLVWDRGSSNRSRSLLSLSFALSIFEVLEPGLALEFETEEMHINPSTILPTFSSRALQPSIELLKADGPRIVGVDLRELFCLTFRSQESGVGPSLEGEELELILVDGTVAVPIKGLEDCGKVNMVRECRIEKKKSLERNIGSRTAFARQK